MKVKFVPQNIELEIAEGQSVMNLALANGISIKSVCKGLPSCAECRVRVVEGEQNILPPATDELALIGTGYFLDRRRLSCQIKCFGDVSIDLTEQNERKNAVGGKRNKRVVAKDDRVEELVSLRKSEDITDTGEGVELDTPRESAPRSQPPRSQALSSRPPVASSRPQAAQSRPVPTQANSSQPSRPATRPEQRPQSRTPSASDSVATSASTSEVGAESAGSGQRKRRRRRGRRSGGGGGGAGDANRPNGSQS